MHQAHGEGFHGKAGTSQAIAENALALLNSVDQFGAVILTDRVLNEG